MPDTIGDSGKEMWNAAGDMAYDLAISAGGSFIAGSGFALGAAYLARQIRAMREEAAISAGGSKEEVPHAELALLSTIALLTFTASERLGFSGIASIFVCGVLTRHYTYHSLSAASQGSATALFATLAMLCENALATMLGVAAFDYLMWLESSHLPLALVTVPVLFIARALNIFPLSLVANLMRKRSQKRYISWSMQIVMWFSGMRGALSFALAITLDDDRFAHPLPPPIFHALVSATLGTIVITTLLMAPATRPLIRLLKLGESESATTLSPGLMAGCVSLEVSHAGKPDPSARSMLSTPLLSEPNRDADDTTERTTKSTLVARSRLTPSPPVRRRMGTPPQGQRGGGGGQRRRRGRRPHSQSRSA